MGANTAADLIARDHAQEAEADALVSEGRLRGRVRISKLRRLVAGMHLEFVEVASSAVGDFDFLFALVFGDEPLEGAVAHALDNVRRAQQSGGFPPRGRLVSPLRAGPLNRRW